MATYDAGDTCLWCFESTSPGSGKWVNRIPANRTMTETHEELEEHPEAEVTMTEVEREPKLYDVVNGYMCDECQVFDYDCAECHEPIRDEEDGVYDTDDTGHWHRDCLPRELWHPDILEDES